MKITIYARNDGGHVVETTEETARRMAWPLVSEAEVVEEYGPTSEWRVLPNGVLSRYDDEHSR